MGELEKKVAEYFLHQQNHDNGDEYREPKLDSPFAKARPTWFTSPEGINCKYINHDLHPQMQGRVYLVWYSQLSAILYLDQQDQLSWLDCHFDDQDFGLFLQKENFLDLLPERHLRFFNIVTLTKLNYLFEPKFIVDFTDIPKQKPMFATPGLAALHQNGMQKLRQEYETLTPSCIKNEKGYATSHFVWARQQGRVFRISCSISEQSDFEYEGVLIVEGVGDWYMPR